MPKPILIAHRGLLTGPNPKIENHPSEIEKSRSLGFDIEIDLWFLDGKWVLGHDVPQYEIDRDWLLEIDRPRYGIGFHAWIHAKNIPALYELQRLEWPGHVFYHQNDDVTLTSSGYLWTYPGRDLTPLSVAVMPEWTGDLDETRLDSFECWGICTDYVLRVRELLDR